MSRRYRSRSRARSTLKRCAAIFVQWTVDVGFSSYTALIRSQALQRFVDWCSDVGVVTPSALSAKLIEDYQEHLGRYRTAKGNLLMPTTQATRINPVKAFCKWLARQRIVESDPAANLILPRLPRRLPSYVPSEGEVQHVLTLPDVTTTAGLRDRAILEVLYSSAIRRLELMALKIADLRFDRHVIWIRYGKGGNERIVPVGDRACVWVQRYLEKSRTLLAGPDSGETLFLTDQGQPFMKNRLGDMVKRYLLRAGVQARGSCHLFRHACPTHMLENGADIRFIQELLGHSDLSTTQIYTRVSIAKLQEVHSRCHPVGGLHPGRE